MWNSSLEQLKNAVSTYDRKNVDRICAELIEHVSASDEAFPESTAKTVLNLLRRKRFFGSMRRVADAFLQSGLATGTVRRQYAQALIECGDFSAAIGVLEKLITEC